MPLTRDAIGLAPTIAVVERGVWRNARNQVDGLEVDIIIDGFARSGVRLKLDPNAPFDSLIADALENDLDAPYIRSVRYGRAVAAVARRGRAQAAALAAAIGDPSRKLARARALNIIGYEALVGQVWEALHIDDDDAPFAIDRPVVRVLADARPYPAAIDEEGVRVCVISARGSSKNDIAPLLVTRPLRDLALECATFGLGVTMPSYPNEIAANILPVQGHEDCHAGAPILHIDSHGELLSYDRLMRLHGEARRAFVADSWGLEIAPYDGLKSFIMIDHLTPDGAPVMAPVAAEELAGLCRQARIPLVVITACRAASDAAQGGFAADLVRAGVPDVIAFRHLVTVRSATLFVRALYGALARGATPADACCQARRALYERGVKAVPEGGLAFPDWISIVHYSAFAVAPGGVQPAATDLVHDDPPALMPVRLEWALVKLRHLVYEARLARALGDAVDLPPPRPIIAFGPVGAGARTLLREAAAWLAFTDLGVSGATLLDLGCGLRAALSVNFPAIDPAWPDDQIVAAIVQEVGFAHVIAFYNVDLALDSGIMATVEYRRVLGLVKMLAGKIDVCLVEACRDLRYERFARALGIDAAALNCWPVLMKDIEDWLLPPPGANEDEPDRLVTTLLAWISAGYIDVAGVVQQCTSPQQREILLDHLVYGTKLENGPYELGILERLVDARWAMASREAAIDVLIPALAALASGVFNDELGKVGRPLGDKTFPSIPRVELEELPRLQAKLIEHGLMSEFANDGPPGWSEAESPRYAALKLNPLLRPLARLTISPALRDALDRWTVAWATDKIHFLSNDWLDPAKRPRTSLFIEHGWPLFAVAIWLARQDVELAAKIAPAIEHAWSIGWWPRALGVAELLGDAASSDATGKLTDFDRLWSRAVQLQQQGDFAEARDLLVLAIGSVGGAAGGYPYYAAQYRLGTLSLDLGEVDQAAEHLKSAAEGAAYAFVTPDTHAHIIYEQGQVARRRGRDEQAMALFKASISQAQALGLHNLICLNYQELTDIELRKIPMFILDDRRSMEINAAWSDHLAQADLYLRSAYSAAARADEPTPEQGTLLLLEARILAARSRFADARCKAQEAIEAFDEWQDHRASVAKNFLVMLEAARGDR